MAVPRPEIGLVIRHAYLWWNEARAGREEGRKDRPCVIVHLRLNEHQELDTYICPVTHTPPEHPEKAMEIPPATKARLGLDDARSWIITTEVNRFIWPGPDLRPVPRGGDSYGPLPAAMTQDLVAQVKANAQDSSLLIVRRTT
ncbi:MAG: type II toxin-antitoxin system PemK/MazF family toxin [Steroidobacteraceae bacterium]